MLAILAAVVIAVALICAIIALVVVWVAGGEFLAVLGAILAAAWAVVEVLLIIGGVLLAIYAFEKLLVMRVLGLLDPNKTLCELVFELGPSFFDVLLAALDVIVLVERIGNLGKLVELLRTSSVILRRVREAGGMVRAVGDCVELRVGGRAVEGPAAAMWPAWVGLPRGSSTDSAPPAEPTTPRRVCSSIRPGWRTTSSVTEAGACPRQPPSLR